MKRLACIILLFTAVSHSWGMITFTVDPNTQTFDISGSVIIETTTFGPDSSLVNWSNSYGSVTGSEVFDLSPYITTSPEASFDRADVEILSSNTAPGAFLEIEWGISFLGSQTVTASGSGIDYSTLATPIADTFEDLASADTVLAVGDGTSSGSILITAVPEPRTAVLAIGAIALLLVIRRRA